MNLWLFILLLFPLGNQSPAGLEVQADDGLVTVRAQAIPLTEVLDRLSEETGAKVVYEGPQPPPLVTVVIERRPVREALTRLLEGLGLNHAFQMDASGRHVEMLIIDEAFGSGPDTATTRGRRPTRTFFRGAPPSDAAEPDTPDDTDTDEDLSGPGGFPAYAGGTPSGEPGELAGPEGDWEPPEFPADASSPIPPGFVPRPVFPGVASQP
jgi:hypothetical protein